MDRRRATTLVAILAIVNLLYTAGIVLHEFVVPALDGYAGQDQRLPDFAAFWAAGRLALEGTPELAYDWQVHRAAEVAGLGHEFDGWMPWFYPPHFQLLVAPLATVPLWFGMALWTALTLGLYLWVCWRILPDPVALVGALAAAPSVTSLAIGQTGFLIGGLLGLLLLNLDRRPVRAGIALGLLSIKPQLALALPFALAADRRWRVLLVATATVLVLAAAVWAFLGLATWAAFFNSIPQTTGVIDQLNQRWEMYASVYGWERQTGIAFLPAMLAHGVLGLAILGATAAAWHSPRLGPDIKAALLCFATAAVTPRILNYDLHILVIGALFQLRHALPAGFYPGEQLLLAAAGLAAFLSLLYAPGVSGFLAPVLFAGCWLGHGRPRETDPGIDPRPAAHAGR